MQGGYAVGPAVDRVFAMATAEESLSLDGLLQAVARDRGRPLTVTEDPHMPAGVFGHWIRFTDRDEVSYASWTQTRDRTIAHELGHIVLGHQGRPVLEVAQAVLPTDMHDLAALILRRDCADAAAAAEELAAEQFASLLLNRLRSIGGREPRLRSRWGEALG
ncbi:ImmA/IrrE family metallo-endopeptidase [Nocardia sp. CS682]|uniref:ImmA/IrrE family metallo-endopeptidase n=1 Tax=Nocardia sp. CS682 TaxID=1047172 RepID=UPI001F0EEA76|nr:ImmA/IrrE family metallo-endopeptidase [Nocardia sp. CS682]